MKKKILLAGLCAALMLTGCGEKADLTALENEIETAAKLYNGYADVVTDADSFMNSEEMARAKERMDEIAAEALKNDITQEKADSLTAELTEIEENIKKMAQSADENENPDSDLQLSDNLEETVELLNSITATVDENGSAVQKSLVSGCIARVSAFGTELSGGDVTEERKTEINAFLNAVKKASASLGEKLASGEGPADVVEAETLSDMNEKAAKMVNSIADNAAPDSIEAEYIQQARSRITQTAQALDAGGITPEQANEIMDATDIIIDMAAAFAEESN